MIKYTLSDIISIISPTFIPFIVDNDRVRLSTMLKKSLKKEALRLYDENKLLEQQVAGFKALIRESGIVEGWNND